MSLLSGLEVVLLASHMYLIGRVYFLLQFEGIQLYSREDMAIGSGDRYLVTRKQRMLELSPVLYSSQPRTPGPSIEKAHPWDSESVFSLWLNLSGNIL